MALPVPTEEPPPEEETVVEEVMVPAAASESADYPHTTVASDADAPDADGFTAIVLDSPDWLVLLNADADADAATAAAPPPAAPAAPSRRASAPASQL